MATAARGYEN